MIQNDIFNKFWKEFGNKPLKILQKIYPNPKISINQRKIKKNLLLGKEEEKIRKFLLISSQTQK